jgi:hypothetical protein
MVDANSNGYVKDVPGSPIFIVHARIQPSLKEGLWASSLAGDCKLRHQPIAIPLVLIQSLNKLFQQLGCCHCIVTVAFELGDDAILFVDLVLAQDLAVK